MALLTAETKQALLIDLYESTTGDGNSFDLYGAIISRLRDNAARIKSGFLVTSHAGNGHATTLDNSGIGGMTPVAANELCAELYNLYNRCKAALITLGTASPTDKQIFDEMMFRLGEPCESVTNDFTNLRWA